VVLGSEAEAYCCFAKYMDTVKDDFIESGMMKKIGKMSIIVTTCFIAYTYVIAYKIY